VIIHFANMLLLSFIKGNSCCNPPPMFMGFPPYNIFFIETVKFKYAALETTYLLYSF
jgi:hypothetical protein